jgi:hypothetical protein
MLLVRIAASRVLHADAVAAGRAPAPPDRLDPAAASGPTPSPVPPPAEQDRDAALGRLLSGEFAAVFAYPLIVARCAPARRAEAGELWQSHVVERDELERLLSAGDGTPPAAEPAYDIGDPPTTPDAAAKLAAKVESGLTAVAVAAIANTGGDDRLLAARGAVTSARRAVSWGGDGAALPG